MFPLLVSPAVLRPPEWSPAPGGAGLVREAPGLYRPRHPESTDLHRLVEGHFEEFAAVHEERFEAEDGPLHQCLEQAILVARCREVDLTEIERWSGVEGKRAEFDGVRRSLERASE